MIFKRSCSIAAAVVVAAATVGPTAPAGAVPAVPQAPGSITLVTGDRVVLGGPGGATVRPAQGREHVTFLTQRDVRGDIHVTPADAFGMLRSGRVDPRLFNVTQLLDHGYGDDARTDIPLIVSHVAGLRSARVVRDLPSVDGSAVIVAKNTSFWSTRGAASRIWLDGPVKALLDRSVPQIGAPAAWQAGYTGAGTTVAVLDTGIDPVHPDLLDAVAGARDFTNSATATADKFGHGTHVASIVTGKNDRFNGVAPDTRLLNGKVLNDRGSGTESGIIAGMQWAVAGGAQVVNMSLGSDFPSDGTDALSQAVNTLTAESGVLFVIAAGNSGSTPGTPAAADAALTVGAVDSTDALAPFSSRGPRLGDFAIKPDITAPGVDIVAAKAKDSVIGNSRPNVGEHHVVISGTSMSTPHVAGAAAILAGQHPTWKAAELKSALMNSARPNPALSVFEQGAGRVDVAEAVARSVVSWPASISNGLVQWPHNDDQPIDNTVTYRNDGSEQVTLNLAAEVRDPAGKPAPTGMFTVSPATLTIAPGGTARATVVTDTTVNGADGTYSGVITAGAARTPITVTREAESYDANLAFVGTDGRPTADYAFRLVDLTKPVAYQPYSATGAVSFRVPKGRYFLEAHLSTSDATAVFAEPELTVAADITLTVDARQGKRAAVTIDRATARPVSTFLEFDRTTEWGSIGSALSGDFSQYTVGASRTSAPGRFRYSAGGQFAEPGSQGGFSESPYLYRVRGDVDGKVPVNPVLHVRDRDLVKVRTTHAAGRPGSIGTREGVITKPLPFTLEELYSPQTPWHGSFSEVDAQGAFLANIFTSAPASFPRVRTATSDWNKAVFGPAFPSNPGRPQRYANRSGDTLVFQIPMFSDSGTNREGFSAHTGTSALYRDGVQVGPNGSAVGGLFEVPAGSGVYRLHAEATRDRLPSNRITVDWTFRSDPVPEGPARPLPLLAVRFTAPVDGSNAAHRVLPSIVPVTVSHNTGAAARPTRIQVSHDSGATWQAAPLLELDGSWFTVLPHPRGAKSVSLKADARDNAGNTVSQTIVDAFSLK
ncbi:MAG: S8 family serine peptidase [Kibdelosporangium sp.]